MNIIQSTEISQMNPNHWYYTINTSSDKGVEVIVSKGFPDEATARKERDIRLADMLEKCSTFVLSHEAYDKLVRLLDEPERELPRLAALMKTKAPWE